MVSAAEKSNNAAMKQMAAKFKECSPKVEASCTGNCQFKKGKCDVSDQYSEQIMQKAMIEHAGDCGPVMSMSMDACNANTVKTACTDKCEWKEKNSVELDDAGKTCKTKAITECNSKPDPTDPMGLKKLCPGVDMAALKIECDAKTTDKAKLDCYGVKCPGLLMMVGAVSCGAAADEAKCKAVNGDLCLWTQKCDLNTAYVIGKMIPDTCKLKTMVLDSMTCGEVKTETKCTGKCKWETSLHCDKEGAPLKKMECESAFDGSELIADMFGEDAQKQNAACMKATTDAGCSGVETVAGTLKAQATGTAVCATLTVFAGLLAA